MVRQLPALGLARVALAACALVPALAAQDEDDDAWLDAAGAVWAHEPPPPAGDDEWDWDLGGLVSVHAIDYDSRNSKSDGFETEALDPVLRGRLGDDLLVWVQLDLDGEDTRYNLREAWVERYLGDDKWLKVGQHRIPLGTEFATRPEDLPLVGYGFPAWLDGRTDTGVTWDGYASDWSWFALSATTGSGFDPGGEERHDTELVGRIAFMPEHDPEHGFDGIFGGLAVSWMAQNHDEVRLQTPLEQTVFTTPELNSDGAHFYHAEFGARYGGFRAGVEQVEGKLESVEIPGGGSASFDELGSWSAFTSYNFTGNAPIWYRGAWKGYGPDDYYEHDQPLPIELALRYSNGDIDRDFFDTGLTTENPSTQEVRTFSAAVSAYVTPLTRLALQWNKVIADHELSTFGGSNRDSSWVLRFDQRF